MKGKIKTELFPKLENWPVERLKPADYNPRTISDASLGRLTRSMAELGTLQPITVNHRTGNIIGGHQRLKVLLARGDETTPVWLVDLAPEKEKAANLQLNNFAGEWDPEGLRSVIDDLKADGVDIDLTGFDPSNLDELLAQVDEPPANDNDAEPQVDRAAELAAEWGVELGQVWELGDHKIICGDCTDQEVIEKIIEPDAADCVFTSPPYGVGVDYGDTYNDTFDSLRASLPKLSDLWMCIVKPGGFSVVNFGDIVSARGIVGTDDPCEYPMALEYWPVFRADGWLLHSRRVWCKPGAGTGSMQCINSNRAATNWEHIWTWRRPGPSMFAKQTTGEYPSQSGWIDSTRSEKMAVGLKDHGAGMPPLPALYSISNHSLEEGIVFEPFSGTGTTIMACERLRRACMAVEINPGYVAVALQRFKDATGKEPELVE